MLLLYPGELYRLLGASSYKIDVNMGNVVDQDLYQVTNVEI
jgi:hypothetical protein